MDESLNHIVCGLCDLAYPFVLGTETKDKESLDTTLEKKRCVCGAFYHDYRLLHCLREDCEMCEYLWFVHNRFAVHHSKLK